MVPLSIYVSKRALHVPIPHNCQSFWAKLFCPSLRQSSPSSRGVIAAAPFDVIFRARPHGNFSITCHPFKLSPPSLVLVRAEHRVNSPPRLPSSLPPPLRLPPLPPHPLPPPPLSFAVCLVLIIFFYCISPFPYR